MTYLLLLLLACNGADDTDDTCPSDSGDTNDSGDDSGDSGDTGPDTDTDPVDTDCPTPKPGLFLVTDDLSQPVAAVSPPGDDRLFVVERRGDIRIIEDGLLVDAPFIELGSLLAIQGSEQGLLGLAFHPDFATNGRFYVDYTATGGDTVIAEYRVTGEDPNVADPTTARVVLTQDQPYANHNGGQLAFGPDGYLYIGLGDGGSAGDPDGNGQDPTTWLGTLLRIDPVGSPYNVPATNPFVGDATGADEVWAYGLRNPWRFSFDRQTGDLWIADVGQNAREEIDKQPANSTGGENYGWNQMEASACYLPGCDQDGLVLPFHEYRHADGCSVTGGYVYRGSAVPELQGHYFFSDYCSAWIHSLDADGNMTDRTDQLDPSGVLTRVSSLGEDAEGELYFLEYQTGSLYKLAMLQ